MNPIGRITWSDPGCLSRDHRHRSVAERRNCLSTPRITIYDGAGTFRTLLDHPDDLEFLSALVIAALRQISETQQKRRSG